LQPPRKLANKKETKYYWPSEKKPLFVVFVYEMEIPVEPEEVEVKIDLSAMYQEEKK
jgi:hypothetical protein